MLIWNLRTEFLSDLQHWTSRYPRCTDRVDEHKKGISFYTEGKIYSDDDSDDEKEQRIFHTGSDKS